MKGSEIHVQEQKSILDSLPIGITVMDQQGEILYINPAAKQFSFPGKEKDSYRNVAEFIPKPERERLLESIGRVYEEKVPNQSIEHVFLPHGEFYFQLKRFPLFNADGDVNGVMYITEDISERIRREKLFHIQYEIEKLSNRSATIDSALRIAGRHLKQIPWIDGLAVYLLEETSEICELKYHYGFSGKFIRKYRHFAMQSRLVKQLSAQKMTHLSGMQSGVTSEIISEGGKHFGIIYPLAQQNKLFGFIILASEKENRPDDYSLNLTGTIASKLAQQIMLIRTRIQLAVTNMNLEQNLNELQTKQQMLIQKSRLESLGEISAGFSHEISQPLAVISMVMENVLHRLNDGQMGKVYLARKLTTIGENITKIQTLIEHIRIFSRDHAVLTLDRVNVNERIHSALSMIGAQLRQRQIRVITDLCSGDCFTLGNTSRFEQVVLNLLTNARDAIELKGKQHTSDGQPRQIRITTRPNGKMIEFSVWDNGVGVSAENLDRLFDPFFTTKSGGTGLGLPIVYGIVSEMYGTITARSQPGEFTEITVSLPLHHPRKEDQKPQP